MEGKAINIFGDKIKPGDDTTTGMMPGPTDGMDKIRYIQQVPTDDEIKELMKGKSAPEKKVLLKEIEKARQAKIHMEYLLEQQKLKADERWAMRNVEERQAILALHDAPIASKERHDPQGIVEERKGREVDFEEDNRKIPIKGLQQIGS